ncbi:hypothetical protein KR009_010512 [Drosophila setifemur]|nr:hypothetical protein KR009_010512 [Drosophila setifemur]
MLLQVLLLIPILGVLSDGDVGSKCEAKSLLQDLAEVVAQNQSVALTKCGEQMLALKDALHEQRAWALKAQDASGEGFSDFMMGHSMWLGSRTTCGGVNEPLISDMTENPRHLLRELAPFPFDYLVAYVHPNSTWHLSVCTQNESLLHIGLCLPRSCETGQVEELLRGALSQGSSFRRFGMDPQLVYAKRPEFRMEFFESSTVRLFLALLGGHLLLSVLATAGLARYSRILACFDLSSNWQRAWQPVNFRQENAAINGLRVVSAFALLGVHIIWYKQFAGDPSVLLLEKVVAMSMRHTYWPIMVEIFFVISGYLTVSQFMRDEQLQQEISRDDILGNGRRFLGQVLRRFLRLVPLQFVTMLLGVVGVEYHRQVSLLHVTLPHDEICRRHWLRNLLFIQNLFPVVELCGSWTWSLACDMQLHILATLLLFLHTRHPRLVRWLAGVLLVVSVLQAVLLMEIFGVQSNFGAFYQAGEWFYVSPVLRLLAYIVGGAYGYTQVRALTPPLDLILPTWWSKLGACLGTGWLLSQVWADQLPAASLLSGAMVAVRLLVATLASHLILCGSTQMAGGDAGKDCAPPIRFLLAVLQSEQLQRISRFTYAIYLLNPLVIMWFYHSFTGGVNADTTMLIVLTVGHSGICYFLAIVVTLLFEMPISRLCSLLTSSRSPKRKKT